MIELKLYDKKIEFASARDKKKGPAVIIEEASSIFLPKIVATAKDIALEQHQLPPNVREELVEKLDPTTWFKNFTRINFLGRSLCTRNYLRVEMANLLKVFENEFVKIYGGDAKSVGNMLFAHTGTIALEERHRNATKGPELYVTPGPFRLSHTQ